MQLLSSARLLKVPVTFDIILGLNSNRSSEPIPPHRHLHQLAALVPYVNFIVLVRKFFMLEFLEHQADFPGACEYCVRVSKLQFNLCAVLLL